MRPPTQRTDSPDSATGGDSGDGPGGRQLPAGPPEHDLAARTDLELNTAMGRLVRYEQQVSLRRQRLQRTTDDCSGEIARRYREGEAQVDDLLT